MEAKSNAVGHKRTKGGARQELRHGPPAIDCCACRAPRGAFRDDQLGLYARTFVVGRYVRPPVAIAPGIVGNLELLRDMRAITIAATPLSCFGLAHGQGQALSTA